MTKTNKNRSSKTNSSKQIRVLKPSQLATVTGGSNKIFVGGL